MPRNVFLPDAARIETSKRLWLSESLGPKLGPSFPPASGGSTRRYQNAFTIFAMMAGLRYQ
jgi:hypothetical protein